MRYAGAVAATVVVVEIVAAVAVAHAISWPLTLLLLVLVSLVGADLLRREGWAAFRGRRREASAERQLGDAAAGVIAAGLVAVPGFVTAVVGLIGLTPPGRSVLRRVLAHRLAAGLVTVSGWQPRRRQPGDDPRVVDSTVDPSPGPVDLGKDDRAL